MKWEPRVRVLSMREVKPLLAGLGLLLVLVVAVAMHFGTVMRTTVNNPIRADAQDYFYSAYNLYHYGIYSRQVTLGADAAPLPPRADSVRTPGYPFFLMAIGKPSMDGPYLDHVLVAQAFVGVATVVLFYLLATSLLPHGWSHAATLLFALDPHLPVMGTYLLSETWFTFLLFLSLNLAVVTARRRSVGWGVATGIVFGLCALTRSSVQFAPWLFWTLCLALPSLSVFRPSASALLAGFLLVSAPWHVRNLDTEPLPDEPSLMVNFVLHGSYPNFRFENQRDSYGIPYLSDPAADAASRSMSTTLNHVGQRALERPGTYLMWYLVGKPGFFLSWTNIDGAGDIYIYPVTSSPFLDDPSFRNVRSLMFLLHWPLVLLGVAGALLVWKRGFLNARLGPSGLVAQVTSAVVLYSVFFHMIGAPYPRYGIPFRPLLFLLAIFLTWRLVFWRTRGRAE